MTTLRQFLLIAVLLVIVHATASVNNPRFRRATGNYGIYKAGPHDANVQVMTDVASAASLDGEYKAGPVAQNPTNDNNEQASNLESQYGVYRAGVADSNAQLKTAPSFSRSRRSYGYNGGSNYGTGGGTSYGYGGQQGGHGGGYGHGGHTPYGRGGFVGNGFSGAGISSGGSQWGSSGSGSSSVGGWQSGGVGSAMNPNDPNFTGQSPPMAVLPGSDQTGSMAGDAAAPPQAATPFVPQPPSSDGGIPPGMAGDPAGR